MLLSIPTILLNYTRGQVVSNNIICTHDVWFTFTKYKLYFLFFGCGFERCGYKCLSYLMQPKRLSAPFHKVHSRFIALKLITSIGPKLLPCKRYCVLGAIMFSVLAFSGTQTRQNASPFIHIYEYIEYKKCG